MRRETSTAVNQNQVEGATIERGMAGYTWHIVKVEVSGQYW